MAATTEVPWRVTMLLHVTGGRGDGSEWPPAGAELVCGRDEAQQLVRGGMARDARPAEDAEPSAEPPAGNGAGDEPPDAENGSQPLVRDPKQAWVDHATGQGADPAEAAQMTKADLIAQYGNP